MIHRRIACGSCWAAALVLGLYACGVPARAGTDPSMDFSPATATIPAAPTPTRTPQPFSNPLPSGPDPQDFPPGTNPLSGEAVEDPSLLQTPALLVSISHFPPLARPQAGLSFAPWVFEYYITEGATRFLAVFHGTFPEPQIPVRGDCEVRHAVFESTSMLLGNRVWVDGNRNGRQEPFEPGAGGVCVNLYDSLGKRIGSTTTDSNGYYGFDLEPGPYTVEFVLPEWLGFTPADVGDEDGDNDAAPPDGRVPVKVEGPVLHLDAGVLPLEARPPSGLQALDLPKSEVGPIRSGRLIYADIAGFFQSSCLIYAFASEEVLAEIPKCSFVEHEDGGGGSMMEIERFKAIAEDNRRHTPAGFNYTGNLFSETPPQGGTPARRLDVYVALLNQSAWSYDPLYGSWLRWVDEADQETAGELHLEVDRLTGRLLDFENLIVIFAEHDVVSPTNLDIHLEQGDGGYAFLFRDGRKYDIRWSTKSGAYEQQSGLRRPIRFLNADGSSAALKPGATWIFVATPYSALTEEGGGTWRLRYHPPDGAK